MIRVGASSNTVVLENPQKCALIRVSCCNSLQGKLCITRVAPTCSLYGAIFQCMSRRLDFGIRQRGICPVRCWIVLLQGVTTVVLVVVGDVRCQCLLPSARMRAVHPASTIRTACARVDIPPEATISGSEYVVGPRWFARASCVKFSPGAQLTKVDVPFFQRRVRSIAPLPTTAARTRSIAIPVALLDHIGGDTQTRRHAQKQKHVIISKNIVDGFRVGSQTR
jgi:hypothetical protein